jgi:IclR family KDG regulon transcriptional repressor
MSSIASSNPPAELKYEIEVVTRAFQILEAFTESRSELGVAEISKRLKLSKNAVFRLLFTLQRGGYVEKNSETKKFRLGLKLFRLGNAVLQTDDWYQLALPIMDQLREQFKETVNLAVMHQGMILYIQRLESPSSLRTSNRIGSRAHVHSCALGKAILAYMDPKEVNAILSQRGLPQMTPNTITQANLLESQFKITRARGYSIDNEENVRGVVCLGAPIFNAQGEPIAAISISGPKERMRDSRKLAEMGQAIATGSRELSMRLGWIQSPAFSERLGVNV